MRLPYSLHHRHHYRRIRHLRRLIAIISIVLIGTSVWLGATYVRKPVDISKPADTKPVDKTIKTDLVTFETPYFTFQAPTSWQQASSQGDSHLYTFRSYNATLVQQDLRVYVGTGLPQEDITRVVPVTVSADGTFTDIGEISEHCKSAVPAGYKNPMKVEVSDVSFTCDSDGTVFAVLAGERQGTGIITLRRPGGGTMSISLIYRDLTALPTGRDLLTILRTLHSR